MISFFILLLLNTIQFIIIYDFVKFILIFLNDKEFFSIKSRSIELRSDYYDQFKFVHNIKRMEYFVY